MTQSYVVRLSDTKGDSYVSLERFSKREDAEQFANTHGEDLRQMYNEQIKSLGLRCFDRVEVCTIYSKEGVP